MFVATMGIVVVMIRIKKSANINIVFTNAIMSKHCVNAFFDFPNFAGALIDEILAPFFRSFCKNFDF